MVPHREEGHGAETPGLIVEQVGEVAVVATVPDADGVRVVCLLDCRNPRVPRVVGVTITGRPLDRKALRSLIPSIDQVEALPTIKVGTMRSFAIGEFEDAARTEVDEYQSMLGDMNALLAWCLKTGFGSQITLPGYSFRTWRDQSAAIRKVVAAWFWAYEVTSTEHLAELFGVTATAAKQLVSQARKAGFLSPGRPGKATAGMTEEGLAFLLAVLEARQNYEKGLQ